MRRSSFTAILTIMAVFCLSIAAFAQTSVADKFLISAKAGGVNHVEGTVSIARADGTGGVLLKGDRVEVGDRVSTGSDGRAEVLLNPGSYIRVSSNSSFEFGTTDLEDLQLKLDSGSAIFEVFAADEFRVSVHTPKGLVSLIETGIYRVDILAGGTAKLSVTKGKAEIGEDAVTLVKDGRAGTIGDDSVAVAKFDKNKRDAFANWSKDRSKELAKVSSSLQDRQLSNSILSGFRNGMWNVHGSFGLWVYDARFGGHCFLPFGNGWRSPYGHWYHNGIYWQYLPNTYAPTGYPGGNPVNPPTNQTPPSWTTSKTGRTPPVNPGTISRTPRTPVSPDPGSAVRSARAGDRQTYVPPPFTRVTRDIDRSSGGGGWFGGGSRSDGFDTSSRSSGPMMERSSPPVVSAPPPPPPSYNPSTATKGNN